GRAEHVAAAVDPHHHRTPRTRVRLRRPDVDRQPVIALRVLRRTHALRGRRSEIQGGPHALPAPHGPRRGETERTYGRFGERDAAEDGHTVLLAAAQRSSRGVNEQGTGLGRSLGHDRIIPSSRAACHLFTAPTSWGPSHLADVATAACLDGGLLVRADHVLALARARPCQVREYRSR